jgi:hypothetical protein
MSDTRAVAGPPPVIKYLTLKTSQEIGCRRHVTFAYFGKGAGVTRETIQPFIDSFRPFVLVYDREDVYGDGLPVKVYKPDDAAHWPAVCKLRLDMLTHLGPEVLRENRVVYSPHITNPTHCEPEQLDVIGIRAEMSDGTTVDLI